MSGRKHHCKHPTRGHSHYPERLRARGLSKTPQLAPLDGNGGLRTKQERRVRDTCSLSHSHDMVSCDGHAWRWTPLTEDGARA